MAKVLFLQNVWIEYYGVMQISALLKKHGHEVDILFADSEETVAKIKEAKPDLIAYSCMSVQWNWAKDIASKIKENGIETLQLIGGIHPTMYPELTIENPAFDILCINEGEYPMLELCNSLDEGTDYSNIKNLWVRKKDHIIKNPTRPKLNEEMLSELPYADRYLYSKYKHFRDYPFVIFVGSRGCPFKCSFCEVPEINNRYGGGKSTYYRNVESFIREIEYVKNQGLLKGKLIMFTDSTFNSHKKWFLNFMKLYKERIGVPFSCNLRVDLVNEDQVKALSEAGCDNVRFGVESGDEGIRNKILNKKLTDDKIFTCSALLREYKIPYITFNLFANPEETYEQAWQTVKVNQRIKPTAMGNYIFLLYPGIEGTNYALKQGLIDEKDLEMLEVPPYNLQLSLLALHPDRNPDIVKICNLHKFSLILVRLPFLEPLVRILCNLPPLSVFNILYMLSQAWEWRKWSTKTTFRRLVYEGILNYQALASKKDHEGGIAERILKFVVKKKEKDLVKADYIQ